MPEQQSENEAAHDGLLLGGFAAPHLCVLHAGNCPNILLACRGDYVAGAIVIKRFDWITVERSWRGAMIGMVYTRPEERGRGLASQLLRAAEQRLRGDGAAFAVLWTAQPAFYARLGWKSADCGVYGTCVSAGGAAAGCAAADASSVDAMRLRNATIYTPRGHAGYATLPPPSEQLHLLASPNGAAYAAYGTQADRAYVYEFGGEPAEYAALWQDISAMPGTIYINEHRGSTAEPWLATIPGIVWRDKALAMWLPLAEPPGERDFARWYIPFLDRI